jgi:3-hydroxyisobutyrate dehydrogenase
LKVGIIGCGNMGGGMARHLLTLGVEALCHDASAELRERLRADGLRVADSASELARSVDLLILSLPNAAIVRQVMDSIAPVLKTGTLVVDTSTSDPTVTRVLAEEARERGQAFLDAPVSGGPVAARGGTMTMLVGGEAEALERARPVLAKLTGKIVHVGPSGAGHAAKIVNNMLCAANLVLVAEGIRLAEAAGVPAEGLLQGINAGSGRSGVSEVNFPRWILSGRFDSGFTMGLMRKDVRLAESLAQGLGVDLPAFEPIARLWAESAAHLADGEDFNAIAAPRSPGK